MEWIKKDTRLPIEEKDGIRVLTFSPIYPKDSEMRHRIMNSQFVKICSEVTHWRKLDEPCDGKNVDASESNCTIHGVSNSVCSDCVHQGTSKWLDPCHTCREGDLKQTDC